MKKFIEPKIDLMKLDSADIIRTSVYPDDYETEISSIDTKNKVKNTGANPFM